eukprot:TRINITY_DN1903_c0_g1_i24.p1 TRINITY_DN1903_c0_g1~~TRINITY_DN1903_c0_g1_i24.p1  ORF type:complete len:393 (-),score=73.03 TRINITY_DN1903_c0_g1_i24:129-1307(-)
MGFSILLFLLPFLSAKPIFVIDAVRHGIHTGCSNLSQVPDITWPLYDELSAGGIRQLYLLGRLRRRQYMEKQQLLPENFDARVVHARASNFRRNFMSAQSYLLGLYPYGIEDFNANQQNVEKTLLVPRIPLQISNELISYLRHKPVPNNIPVFPLEVLDPSIETVVRIHNCPIFGHAIQSYHKSSNYSALIASYASLWETIQDAYPLLTKEYLATGDNAIQIANFFLSAEGMGIRPDKFTDQTVSQFKGFWGKALEGEMTYNPMLVTISITQWTKDIVEYMDRALKKEDELKYVFYSTHSRGVFSLLMGIKKFNSTVKFEKDEFATNILFELNEEQNEHFVVVYYNGEVVHKEKYKEFREKFLAAGDLKMSRGDACRAPNGYVEGSEHDYCD